MTLATTDMLSAAQLHRSPASAPLFVFAGGGTGGHLYPALAVVQALRAQLGAVRVVFFGTQRSIDALVLAHAGETLVPQGVQPVPMTPWKLPGFLRSWRLAVRRCRAHFTAHRPAMVIGTGGFASGPAVRVAARRGIPTALMNPDLVPGRANRYLVRSVECIFAQFAESAKYFPGGAPVEAMGCPVRPAFRTAERAEGQRIFNLDPARRTLLVTGASLGAHTINSALMQLARRLALQSDWQVLHLAGRDDVDDVRTAYAQAGVPGCTLAYTERMPEAMATADLLVSRAGASTIAEILAASVPSVLLPYPHHRDQHQLRHAQWLAERGAAMTCIDAVDEMATADALWRCLSELMSDHERRKRMRQAARELDRPDAAERIAARIVELAGCYARIPHEGE